MAKDEDGLSIEITTKRERALLGLALYELASPKAADLLKDLQFLFRGANRVSQSLRKANNDLYNKISNDYPNLNPSEVFDRMFEEDAFQSRLLKERSKRSLYFQCIILQVSKWMKGVIKESHQAVENFAERKYRYDSWSDFLLTLGPKYKRGYWANAMIVASNYVRHFEEWDYDFLEKSGSDPAKVQFLRKNFLESLKGKKARRNAQTLIDVGVRESDLFSPLGWGPLSIAEALDSESMKSMLKNCKAWQAQVLSFTSHIVKGKEA